jgi:hypothetical protein
LWKPCFPEPIPPKNNPSAEAATLSTKFQLAELLTWFHIVF